MTRVSRGRHRGYLAGVTRKLLVAAALGGMLSAPHAEAAVPNAKLVGGGGCTKDAPEGSCKEAASGAWFAAQTFFVAGKEGATLELSDKSMVRLTEGTEVRLLPRTKLQLGKGDTPAEAMQLYKGKLFADLSPARGGAMLVKSGHQQTAAVIKRGNAVVKISEEVFVLAMLKGVGVVGSGSDYNDVLEGKVRVMRKGDPKGTTRDLLKAPEGKLSAAILMKLGAGGDPARLSWGALAGAEAYEVEVRPTKGAATQKKLPKGATELALEGLGGGAYEVAVRGIDAEDFESPWSAPVRLSVVGVELPPGASALGDTVQLPDKGKIKLKATEGLEASYDQLTTFVPAPGEVGLSAGQAQTLRLRRRGEELEVRLKIVPRSYKAQVELSPRNARWPENPVQIDLQLVSGNGLPAPTDIEMVPRVTVDQEQVTPTWAREGGRMKATVPPRADGKPHVVRVEVNDQHGFFLGRGFLEVAAR